MKSWETLTQAADLNRNEYCLSQTRNEESMQKLLEIESGHDDMTSSKQSAKSQLP